MTMSSGSTTAKELTGLVSPLSDSQLTLLQQTATQLSASQLAWISGYFWGVSQAQPSLDAASTAPAATLVSTKPAGKLTIIYASQTGNAKGVAEALASEAQSASITTQLFDASDYKAKDLTKETHVIIVSSTNGEGEAPDNALELHEFLQSKKAPKLPNLKYGVIALGDSSYEHFCQTGKDFDGFLEKLGAQRFIDRVDCDVDYSAPATQWRANALEIIKEALSVHQADVVQLPVGQSAQQSVLYTKQNPYPAVLVTNQKITGRDSDKDVRHIEIDLSNSGIRYQAGDALGIWYQNDPQLAQRILTVLQLDGTTTVTVDEQPISLLDALIHHYEITNSNPQLITALAELAANEKLTVLVQDKNELRHYAAQTQIIDVLQTHKVQLSGEQLISLLRRLTPRLYSIASSQNEVDEEVHLTVGLVEYSVGDETRQGGASGFLAERLEEGGTVKVFVESNNHFKLPEDSARDIIMVGPGTGIAPFRGFMQERESQEATGKNWLFFGDRTFTQDFLYQIEWQRYLKSGLLTHLDLAFSRDQAEKIYVQQRLLEKGQAVWQWLQNGAYFYVCGDATYMAKDVHEALLNIAQQQGKLTLEEAEQYLTELRKAKRYQKDVY